MSVSLTKVHEALDRIAALDTPENERRLRSELERRGLKLKKRGSGAARFAVISSNGNEMQGVTLADVEDLILKLGSS